MTIKQGWTGRADEDIEVGDGTRTGWGERLRMLTISGSRW